MMVDALLAPKSRPLPRPSSIRNVLAYSAACTVPATGKVTLPLIGN